MTFILVLTALLLAAWLVALVRAVHHDGLGTRRPPRSHTDWWDDPAPG